MLSHDARLIATKAKSLYQQKYRTLLEQDHHGMFVCIEPESGDYFLGDTFDAAVNRAIDIYLERRTYTLRIGHAAAVHLGVMTQ